MDDYFIAVLTINFSVQISSCNVTIAKLILTIEQLLTPHVVTDVYNSPVKILLNRLSVFTTFLRSNVN